MSVINIVGCVECNQCLSIGQGGVIWDDAVVCTLTFLKDHRTHALIFDTDSGETFDSFEDVDDKYKPEINSII